MRLLLKQLHYVLNWVYQCLSSISLTEERTILMGFNPYLVVMFLLIL